MFFLITFFAKIELIWSESDGLINHVNWQYILQPEQKSINLTLYCDERELTWQSRVFLFSLQMDFH